MHNLAPIRPRRYNPPVGSNFAFEVWRMKVFPRAIRLAPLALMTLLLNGCPPPEPVASVCDCFGKDGARCPSDAGTDDLRTPDGTDADSSGTTDLAETDVDATIDDIHDWMEQKDGGDDTTDLTELPEDMGPPCPGTASCFEKGLCEGKVITWCDGTEWRCSYDLVPGFEWGGELTCDGLDNDCDGQVDEDLPPPPDTCLLEGVCAAAVPACTGGKWDCGYGKITAYQAGSELTCDGLDNDCDGTPDDGLCQAGKPGDQECSGPDAYHVLQNDGNSWGAPKACKAGQSCMGLGICTANEAWQVNEFDTDGQRIPQVARLGSGAEAGAAVVWQSEGQDGGSFGIYYSTYSAEGTEVLAEKKLNLFTKGAQQHPAAVSLGTDAFFAGWESADQDGSGLGLFGRIVFAGGTAGSELVLPATTAVDQKDLALAPLGAVGDVLAVWADNSQGNLRLKGGHISAAGWPWTLEVGVTTQSKDDDTRPAIATVGADAAVVVWERKVGLLTDLYVRRIEGCSAEAWQLGTEIPVSAAVMENESKGQLVASQSFVHVAWVEEQAKRICVRRFKLDLSAAGDAVCMPAESGGVQAVALAVLAEDEVAVAWQEGPSLSHKVKLASFAGGTTFGGTILVDLGAMDPDGSLSMAAFAGGKVLVAWARSGIATGLDVWAKFVQM